SNTVTATVGTGRKPYGVVVTPDGSKGYVAHAVTVGFVTVIATASNTVTPAIRVGEDPIAFGVFIGPAPTAPPSFGGDAWVLTLCGPEYCGTGPAVWRPQCRRCSPGVP